MDCDRRPQPDVGSGRHHLAAPVRRLSDVRKGRAGGRRRRDRGRPRRDRRRPRLRRLDVDRDLRRPHVRATVVAAAMAEGKLAGGGADVAAADATGDRRAEVVVGLGPGCCTSVHVWNVLDGSRLGQTFPFGDRSGPGRARRRRRRLRGRPRRGPRRPDRRWPHRGLPGHGRAFVPLVPPLRRGTGPARDRRGRPRRRRPSRAGGRGAHPRRRPGEDPRRRHGVDAQLALPVRDRRRHLGRGRRRRSRRERPARGSRGRDDAGWDTRRGGRPRRPHARVVLRTRARPGRTRLARRRRSRRRRQGRDHPRHGPDHRAPAALPGSGPARRGLRPDGTGARPVRCLPRPLPGSRPRRVRRRGRLDPARARHRSWTGHPRRDRDLRRPVAARPRPEPRRRVPRLRAEFPRRCLDRAGGPRRGQAARDRRGRRPRASG